MLTPPKHVTYHVSRVTSPVTSRVTCHMSRVTCHMSHFFFVPPDKAVKFISGGSVINGASNPGENVLNSIEIGRTQDLRVQPIYIYTLYD